jgi:hypothetical protein
VDLFDTKLQVNGLTVHFTLIIITRVLKFF